MSNWIDIPSGLSLNEYWFTVATAAVTAVIAFVAGLLWLRRAWVIEDTPTSMIRSAAQGYVELQGEAMIMAGTPIVAPLSFLPCAWYRYSVEKRVSDDDQDKLAGSWRTIENGVSDGLFLLRDDTGACVVDPEGAVVTPAENLLWYGDSRIPPPGPGVPRMWALGSTYRFREERIRNGDYLYAIGNLCTMRGDADAPTNAEEVRDLLAAWKRDQASLRARFDTNKDGVIDQDEWEQVRRAAEREVTEESRSRLCQPGLPVFGRPPDTRRPFLLSNLPSWRLSKRYRWWAGGSLLTFLLAGTLAVWLVSMR
jgi:hypothetical protein